MFRVGLNKLETISQLVRTMSTDRVQEYLSSIPIVTKSLLLFNIAVHVVLFVTSFPVNDLAINPLVIIVHGEYYRMVSSAFVHGGLMHIVMNMSTLLAIGGSLENQYGTIPMLFLTLWCLLLCGATFVCMVWAYAIISSQPGELNTSAVGYSGVLFSYALIDAFHSVETSRSVFGMFSVPTKAYPFILLALIQVCTGYVLCTFEWSCCSQYADMKLCPDIFLFPSYQVLMPNISFWGHLSGLVVGLLLISQIGVSLFMPTYGTNVFVLAAKDESIFGIYWYIFLADCMVYLEQMVPCCRPLVLCGGYVPVRDKDLVHAYLRCSTAGGGGGAGTGDCCSSCCAGIKSGLQAVAGAICYVCVFFWQILVFLLTMIGKFYRVV